MKEKTMWRRTRRPSQWWWGTALPLFLIIMTCSAQAQPLAMQQPDALTILGQPLHILVGRNASVQVYHQNYEHGQVFGDADSGIFVWLNGDLYGSDLRRSNGYSFARRTLPFTVASHSGPSGNGSGADPWVVTTVLDAGTTGLRITQRISYVNGQEYFNLHWSVGNRAGAPLSFDFFHAADLYFANSDYGFGYYDPVSGAVGGYNRDRTWYMSFIPEVPVTAYQEAEYTTIWQQIGECSTPGQCRLGPGFNSTILADQYLDNGAGFQWRVNDLAPGARVELGDWWTFGIDRPVPPSTATPTASPTARATPTPTQSATPLATTTGTRQPTLTPTAPPPQSPTPTPTALPMRLADGMVYVVALAEGEVALPVDLYVAGTFYHRQVTARNTQGEQQATFVLWPRHEIWTISLVPGLPPGYDPQEWRVDVREGSGALQVRYGDRPVWHLRLVRQGS
jgi:hypothetical protein